MEEKKRLKRGKVDGFRGKSLIICLPLYRPQCLIIYRPEKSTCILPPIPNYLSTYQLHYYTSSKPLLHRSGEQTTPNKNNHPERDGEKKRGWKRRKEEECGEHYSKTIKTTQNSVGIRKRGSVGMEQMRRMDEMVMRLRRSEIEQMKDKKSRKQGKGRTMMEKRVIPFSPLTGR